MMCPVKLTNEVSSVLYLLILQVSYTTIFRAQPHFVYQVFIGWLSFHDQFSVSSNLTTLLLGLHCKATSLFSLRRGRTLLLKHFLAFEVFLFDRFLQSFSCSFIHSRIIQSRSEQCTGGFADSFQGREMRCKRAIKGTRCS